RPLWGGSFRPTSTLPGALPESPEHAKVALIEPSTATRRATRLNTRPTQARRPSLSCVIMNTFPCKQVAQRPTVLDHVLCRSAWANENAYLAARGGTPRDGRGGICATQVAHLPKRHPMPIELG